MQDFELWLHACPAILDENITAFGWLNCDRVYSTFYHRQVLSSNSLERISWRGRQKTSLYGR